jgi:pSer/pThr/pTyr-binding forkhead associated (FHA) protein
MSDEMIDIPQGVFLNVIEGEDVGTSYTVEKKSVTIGRQDECELILEDKHVSNKHCQIVFRGGHFSLIDLGSLNKTKVNDKIIVQKNLTNGDLITIGKTKIKFVWENEEEEE